MQVSALAQLAGVPLQDQANFLMRRAMLCKANRQPFVAFASCLHASQVPPKPLFASSLVAPQDGCLRKYSWLCGLSSQLNLASKCLHLTVSTLSNVLDVLPTFSTSEGSCAHGQVSGSEQILTCSQFTVWVCCSGVFLHCPTPLTTVVMLLQSLFCHCKDTTADAHN